MTSMNAAVYTRYGQAQVLQMKQVAKPEPKVNEVLIRIKSTAVNSGDLRLRKADPFAVRFFFGLFKPKVNILGAVYSGEIEAVGKDVRSFKTGDAVFGHTDMKFGAYAEYICVREDSSIAVKPANITHSGAAAIPFGGVTALHFIRKAAIKPNQKVLVVGAMGSVGSAAVQIAKSFGAIVTAVCSTAQIELVKSIGADKVIDYKKEDFTRGEEVYDIIFDSINAASVLRASRVLAKNGVMILGSAGVSEMLIGSLISLTSGKRVLKGVIAHDADSIKFLQQAVEQGKYQPLIDRSFPLTEIAEAHSYYERGGRMGSVTINIG